MNAIHRERLDQIACWLEAGGDGQRRFDMRVGLELDKKPNWFRSPDDCGTTCCIAGAAVSMFAERISWSKRRHREVNTGLLFAARVDWPQVRCRARDLLGLSAAQAEELFLPDGYRTGKIDAAWAARCIRHFMATGEIDWAGTKDAQVAEKPKLTIVARIGQSK